MPGRPGEVLTTHVRLLRLQKSHVARTRHAARLRPASAPPLSTHAQREVAPRGPRRPRRRAHAPRGAQADRAASANICAATCASERCRRGEIRPPPPPARSAGFRAHSLHTACDSMALHSTCSASAGSASRSHCASAAAGRSLRPPRAPPRSRTCRGGRATPLGLGRHGEPRRLGRRLRDAALRRVWRRALSRGGSKLFVLTNVNTCRRVS